MMRQFHFDARGNRTGLLDPDEILADSTSALSSDVLEGRMERPLGRFSALAFIFVVGAAFVFFLWRAGTLQLERGDSFFAQSQENRFVTRSLFPPRGVVYDHRRMPMVENVPSFGLLFERDQFMKSGMSLEQLVKNLGELLGQDGAFFLDLGFPHDGKAEAMPSRLFVNHAVALDAIVAVVTREDRFPGIRVVENYRRLYKDSLAYAHLVGFVGKISEEDLKKRPELAGEETVGKSGIEFMYDQMLRGKGGKKIIEVDSRGKETRFRLTHSPEEGSPLVLALDSGLQEIAYKLLEDYTEGKKGASVVALDPRSGAVRALVSFPGFDSNRFGSFLSHREFEAVLNDPRRPLFNRAIAGEFPPGSTLKPLMGAAMLEEKIIDPEKKIYDPGFLEIPHPYRRDEKSIFRDWRAHGWVNFYDAIALSANVYFYIMGGGYRDQEGLGIERIKQYAAQFGLGSRLGIDLPGEKPGFLPDPSSKQVAEPQDPIWRVGDTYNVSIGQGGMKVTPLQITSMVATIANGGTVYEPYVVESALDKEGKVVKKVDPAIIRRVKVREENLAAVRRGMRQTVTQGTARLLSEAPVAVAAKTGTAQASGLPHAWVSAFAPFENPEIAITVMVEHAGEGATVAVPITKEILKWYFANR